MFTLPRGRRGYVAYNANRRNRIHFLKSNMEMEQGPSSEHCRLCPSVKMSHMRKFLELALCEGRSNQQLLSRILRLRRRAFKLRNGTSRGTRSEIFPRCPYLEHFGLGVFYTLKPTHLFCQDGLSEEPTKGRLWAPEGRI